MRFGKIFPTRKVALLVDSLYGNARNNGAYTMTAHGRNAIDTIQSKYILILFSVDSTPMGIYDSAMREFLLDSFDCVWTAKEHYATQNIKCFTNTLNMGDNIEDLLNECR